jgi:hypothetical protein
MKGSRKEKDRNRMRKNKENGGKERWIKKVI